MPQTGYIHPDEFFQSAEVVTGDVFGVDVVRTWEFNSSSPIRSSVVNNILLGTPLRALRVADAVLHYYTGWNATSGYLVLLLPRLVMLAMSFTVDYSVYQTCLLYKHSYNQCLTTLASSYVMLVHATRTMSNSVELVLFSFLFYLVAHCMKRTSETVYFQSMVQVHTKIWQLRRGWQL